MKWLQIFGLVELGIVLGWLFCLEEHPAWLNEEYEDDWKVDL